MKVALIVNMIPPYREAVTEGLHRALNGGLVCFMPKPADPLRQWSNKPCCVPVWRLPGIKPVWAPGRVSDVTTGMGQLLEEIDPSLVIISGFSPMMLAAARWAHSQARPLVLRMDGWEASDPGRWSPLHRMVRRYVTARSTAGIAMGKASKHWLAKNGMPEESVFIAPPVPHQSPEMAISGWEERDTDLLWVGALQHRKGADLFGEIATRLWHRRGGLKITIAGSGPLDAHMREKLGPMGAQFLGHISTEASALLPRRAKLVMVPSRYDAGPVSALEAALAGTPLLLSDRAGYAQEGFATAVIDPNQIDGWCDRAIELITDQNRWSTASAQIRSNVLSCDVETAVSAHLAAINHAMGGTTP